MNAINFKEKDIIKNFINIYNHIVQKSREWGGYTVTIMRDLPAQMQGDPHAAFTIIVSTNILFFSAINWAVNHLDRRWGKSLVIQVKALSFKHKLIKQICLNGIIATSMLVFNKVFSKITQYPLTNSSLSAIIGTAIAIRLVADFLFIKTKKSVPRVPVVEVEVEVEEIPIPPSMEVLAEVQPCRTFDNEPKEPVSIKLSGTPGYVNPNVMSQQQIEKEIPIIEAYVATMDGVLKRVDELIKEEQSLEANIKTINLKLHEIDQEIEKINNKLKILQEQGPVSIIKLPFKVGESEEYPAYSQEKFDEINEEFAKRNLPALDEKFLRSNQLSLAIKDLNKLEEQKNEEKLLLEKEKERVNEINQIQNNGIPFHRFQDLVTQKNLEVNKWRVAIVRRRQRLKALLAPKIKEKVLPLQPPSQKSIKPAKAKIGTVLKDQALLDKIPELSHLKGLYSNMQAQILLNNRNLSKLLTA